MWLAWARVCVLIGALSSCSMEPPANANPCELEGHASHACQIYMYSRAGP